MTSFIYDDRSVKLGTPIYSLPESSYRIVSLISAAYRVFFILHIIIGQNIAIVYSYPHFKSLKCEIWHNTIILILDGPVQIAQLLPL